MINPNRKGQWFVFSIYIGLFILGCSQSGHKPVNDVSLQLYACERAQLRGQVVFDGAQCGVLPVPEDPQRPEGRQIQLNIVRLPALSNNPQSDPLFVFAGGPGQAATEIINAMVPLIIPINKQRDIVFVDQRGTGQSNPLDCLTETADYSLSPDESRLLQRKQLQACIDEYEADLRFYTTPYAVDDIEQVRKALGYDKINLWGASYGTRAALVYIRRHPDSVRTAVLDSVAPIGIYLPHYALNDADNAMRAIIQVCEAQNTCRKRFGDLESRVRGLISQLNKNPQVVELEHPLTQKIIKVHINGDLVASVLRSGLYNRELGPDIPLMIEAAEHNDFRSYLVLLTLSEAMIDSVSVGLQQTILCAEDVLRPVAESISKNSLLQMKMLDDAKEVCHFWPKGNLPEDYFRPVASNVPILLLSGKLDPVTPPRWGDFAAESLSNSKHLIVEGTHHGSSFVGCMPKVIAEFIDEGSHQALAVECLEDIRPFPAFVSAAGPSMENATGGDTSD